MHRDRWAAAFIAVAASLLIGGCETAPRNSSVGVGVRSAPDAFGLTTAPFESAPVFLGVSPRLKNREEEESVALAHAALQASRFYRLKGEAAFFARRGSGGTRSVESVSIDDDYREAADLEERLVRVDGRTDETGSWYRYLLADARIGELAYQPRAGSNVPEWTRTIPRIPGYFAGVGTASRSRLLVDTIETADRAALYAILSQLAVEVSSDRFERVVDGSGTTTGSVRLERARGEVVGFYVLDRYVGPDGTVFTLAICPREPNL